MDINEIRRENLRRLVGQFKTKAEFARCYRVDPTYVSQLLNKHRNFGEKAAQRGHLCPKPHFLTTSDRLVANNPYQPVNYLAFAIDRQR